MTSASGFDAKRVRERAKADPEFDARLREAYRGRHDVLDALWWAANPLTKSPRGTHDPSIELKALQRAAFSREAADSPTIEVTDSETGTTVRMNENERRLHEARQLLAEDARYLAEAVAAALAAHGSTAPHRREPVADTASGTAASDSPAPSARRFLLPALSVVVVLAAILVLPTLSQLGGDEAADAPASAGDSQPVERAEIVTLDSQVNVGDPLAVLDRPQVPGERPDGELRFSAETYRLLPGLVPHARLYLARGNQTGSICFVVIRQDGVDISTCQPQAGFSDPALKLGSGRYRISPQMTILTESYAIFPNGDLVYEATARVIGDPAFGTPAEEMQTEVVRFHATGNVGDPIAILNRPMTEDDQPGIGFGYSFSPGSFRALPKLVGHLELYIARGEDGEAVCLVVVHENGSSGASCMPESGFLERGLELGGSGTPMGVDTTILSETSTLLANGDFRYDATARTRLEDGGSRIGKIVEGG